MNSVWITSCGRCPNLGHLGCLDLIHSKNVQTLVQTCEVYIIYTWTKNTKPKTTTTRLAQVFLQVLVLLFYTEGLFNLDEDNFGSMGSLVKHVVLFCNSIIPIIPNRSGFANGHEWFYHDNPTIFQPMFFSGTTDRPIIQTVQYFVSLPIQSHTYPFPEVPWGSGVAAGCPGISLVGVLRRDRQLHGSHAACRFYMWKIWHPLLSKTEAGIPKDQLAWYDDPIWICETQLVLTTSFVCHDMLLHSHLRFCYNLARLRLALVFLLKAKVGDCISWLAIKCSSFTAVNRGTSKRSASNSVGDTSAPSVSLSNGMLERTTQFCLCASMWMKDSYTHTFLNFKRNHACVPGLYCFWWCVLRIAAFGF